ncbi:MAG: ChbG/HpnK family deacetylase [Rhodomicrobium sp.]
MAEGVIINADDYAMDGDVDAAILKLSAEGVVTSTSAMVLSPAWPEAAAPLKDAPLSRGLHLDFTSPFAGDVFPRQTITGLTMRTHSGVLDRKLLRKEIDRQLSQFETRMKAPPDFVDGHQHCHLLPFVREALLDALADRYGADARRISLRNCAPRRWRGLKAAIIARTGTFRLEDLAREREHRMNSDFAGVYDFNENADFKALWTDWLAGLEGASPLVMCHVAVRGDYDGSDPIRGARYLEYAWLASAEFRELTRRLSRRPERWPQA